mgnify:CR=1 FL=1
MPNIESNSVTARVMNPEQSYNYAKYVIKGRFPEGPGLNGKR